MAVTYTWQISSLKTKDQGENINAVVQVYWKKIGTDEHGHSESFEGATPFTAADVPADQFIAFENLQESTVLSWVQSVVTGDYEQHVNSKIQEKIDRHHITQPGLPWAPELGQKPVANPQTN